MSELYGALDKRCDLKWKFPKETELTGVYDDFSTLAPDPKNKAEPTPIVSLSNILLKYHNVILTENFTVQKKGLLAYSLVTCTFAIKMIIVTISFNVGQKKISAIL